MGLRPPRAEVLVPGWGSAMQALLTIYPGAPLRAAQALELLFGTRGRVQQHPGGTQISLTLPEQRMEGGEEIISAAAKAGS